MKVLGTRTEQHLKDAFAGESKANRRYLYFANMADIPQKVKPDTHMVTWNI